MRVELPSPAPGNAPGSTPPASTSIAKPSARPQRPAPAFERLALAITRPLWAWTLAVVTLLLFAWSFGVRRPMGERYLTVSARGLALGGGTEDLSAVTAGELDHLRKEVENIKGNLVGNRKELLPLLFSLETKARAEGWRCERSMMPAQTYANTLTNLELHPVVFRLYPTTAVTPGLYTPLLRWLHAVSNLEKRGEIASLQVQADASGIQRADVRIHFFSLTSNEEASPK